MQLSQNAIAVLEKRYLGKDKAGKIIETPEQLFERVARTVAGAEKDESMKEYEEKFYKIMTNLEFLPNTPTLINAGKELGQLSACFVLGIDDSMESIFTTLRDAALVQKSGGGCGYSFSNIRPADDVVRSTNKCAGGPIVFIRIFDRAMEAIKQGGVRHGANLGTLRVDHPDIYDFIECKKIEDDIPNFNLSVGITDEFMSAVKNDRKHQLINPRSGAIVKEVSAKKLFDLIIKRAWSNGEPGVLFLDEMNRHNMVPHIGSIEATNPCLPSNTLIKTTIGNISIGELAKTRSRSADVYCMIDGKLAIRRAFNIRATTKHAVPLVTIKTTRGNLRCTPNHKIYTKRGKIEAKDLNCGDILIGLREQRRGHQYIGVSLSCQDKYDSVMEHRFVAEHYYGKLSNKFDINHINDNSHDNRIVNLQVLPHDIHLHSNAVGNTHQNVDEKTGRYMSKGDKLQKKIKNTGNKIGGWYVTDVVNCGEKEAVYNMTVDEAHNYIADGILVGNCGEQPLLAYESCNLGSINLDRFVKAGKIDNERLEYVVRLAVRFLDNVIDMNRYPISQIETKTKMTRKIGLGIMGFADMLIKLNIQYDTDEAVRCATEIMRKMHILAVNESEELAKSRGVFPSWRGSRWQTENGIRLRNAALTTVAPTGTLSILANCSSGCEPYYSKSTKKHILNTILEEEVEYAKSDCFITAREIPAEWHVRVQAAFQLHTDAAVSKTINFPNDATEDDVRRAILLAYKLKCKGIAVYRDGSRKTQVLTDSEGRKDFVPVKDVTKCPTCGSPVKKESGCTSCTNGKCGWSACNIA